MIKKIILKVLIGILSIHTIMYLFISGYMLEHEVRKNLLEFNERREASKWNVTNVDEEYFLSSCGDEFFRNYDRTIEYVRKNIPRDCDPPDGISIETLEAEQHYRNISIIDWNTDFVSVIKNHTSSDDSRMCLVFNVCRTSNIPLFYTKLKQEEIFTTHQDFHAMVYNAQIVGYDVHYLWFICTWVRINKKLIEK